MTTTGTDQRTHPITGCTAQVSAALSEVADVPVWSMSPDEQRTTLVNLAKAEAQLTELRLRVLAAADSTQVGAESGATSTASWLAAATRETRTVCAGAVALARDLDVEFDLTRRALAAGEVNPEQARVIVAAVNRLEDHVPRSTRREAEAHLVDLAGAYDAVLLRTLGRKILEVVDPAAAEAAEARALARDEERARRKASLSMRNNGDGTVAGWFCLPELHAAILTKTVHNIIAPRRFGQARLDPVTGKKTPHPVLMGQGFMELIENLPVDDIPGTGDAAATVVVTLGLEQLLSGLGAAGLDTGEQISASEARRLACKAGIIPMVLGGESLPLDLGRKRRLFTHAQRLALAHRFGGCAVEHCTIPPQWCEAHHHRPWSRGGATDLTNGLLLCPPHHRMADTDTHTMTTLPDGTVRFHRRT